MSYEVESVDAITRRVVFKIPSAEVEKELAQSYRQLRGRIRLPGFRQGKVPRNVLEMRFGRQVTAEVGAKLIQAGWEQVQGELEILGQPSLEQDELKRGTDFGFSFTLEIKPDLTIEDYRGMEVPFPEIEVPQEAVEHQIVQRLEGAARIVEVTGDHSIGTGDIVITELVLKDGDEEVVREAGTSIRVGEERYYPGADELLIGLDQGGEAAGQVTIGEDSQLEELRGRELSASVKVISIQASQAPELTDEVAAELGFEGGIEGMRFALQEEIRGPMEEQARGFARQALLHQLVEANDLKAPKALVSQQFEMLVMERRVMHQYSGQPAEKLDMGAEVMEQIKDRAVYAVRASMILEAIAKQEDLVLSDQELEDAYQRIADERGQRVEAIKGYLQKEEGAVETLSSRLLEEKVLDWLLEQAELVDMPEPPPADDPSAEDPAAEDPSAEDPSAEEVTEGSLAEE